MSRRNTSSCNRKEIMKILKKGGWICKSRSGHYQFTHPFKPGKVTMPHNITRNIYLSILAQAGLRRNIYREAGK